MDETCSTHEAIRTTYILVTKREKKKQLEALKERTMIKLMLNGL
jgi:hypothetical protein